MESQTLLIFTNSQLQSMLVATDAELKAAESFLVKEIKTMLEEPIRTENVAIKRAEIETQIRQQSSIDEEILSAIIIIGRAAIIETEVLDDSYKRAGSKSS